MQAELNTARTLERDLEGSISAARRCHELCERRVKQLDMAVESDLFSEFEEDDVNLLRELAASVRIKHEILPKKLAEARRLADECDEIVTAYLTNERLEDDDGQHEAERRLIGHLDKLRHVVRRGEIVCALLKQQEQTQLTVFERMCR